MPGFWEALVATHVFNTTLNLLQTINEFKTSIEASAAGGVAIFPDANCVDLFIENHVNGSTGPTGAGWSVFGTGKEKTVNIRVANPAIPADATGVYLQLSAVVNMDIGQAAGVVNTCLLNCWNPATAYNDEQRAGLTATMHQTAPVNNTKPAEDALVLVPISVAEPSVRFFSSWPNLGVTLGFTFVRAAIVGYMRG